MTGLICGFGGDEITERGKVSRWFCQNSEIRPIWFVPGTRLPFCPVCLCNLEADR